MQVEIYAIQIKPRQWAVADLRSADNFGNRLANAAQGCKAWVDATTSSFICFEGEEMQRVLLETAVPASERARERAGE